MTQPDFAAQFDARLNQFHGGLLQVWRQLLDTRRTVAALDARERLRSAGRSERMPVEFRSQFGEDLAAWSILGKPLEGFFIEVGAFDGLSYSTSYAFEAMGWRGLLVEAIPERHAACVRNRPGSRVVHAALGAPGGPGEVTFNFVQDQYGGMLSYVEGSESPVSRSTREAGYETRRVTVPRTTMDALLAGHTGAIDLVTIDVEGAEADLLAGFDIARWRPRVVLIEDSSFGQNPAVDAMMARGPYTQVGWIEPDRVYVRSDEVEAIARAREVL